MNVLNGRVEAFETMPVEPEVESVDGHFTINISALTIERVTGNLRIIDCRKESNKWKCLQGIAFPKQSTACPIVVILIGIDCLDLHYSYEDVQGFPGDPISRHTPLGWSCIGLVSEIRTARSGTVYIQTLSMPISFMEKQSWRKLI